MCTPHGHVPAAKNNVGSSRPGSEQYHQLLSSFVSWSTSVEWTGRPTILSTAVHIDNSFNLTHQSVEALVIEYLFFRNGSYYLSYCSNASFPHSAMMWAWKKIVNLRLLPIDNCLTKFSFAFNEITAVVGTYLFGLASPCDKSAKSIYEWRRTRELATSIWMARIVSHVKITLYRFTFVLPHRTSNGPKQSTPVYVNILYNLLVGLPSSALRQELVFSCS